jgi:hypothetical protein
MSSLSGPPAGFPQGNPQLFYLLMNGAWKMADEWILMYPHEARAIVEVCAYTYGDGRGRRSRRATMKEYAESQNAPALLVQKIQSFADAAVPLPRTYSQTQTQSHQVNVHAPYALSQGGVHSSHSHGSFGPSLSSEGNTSHNNFFCFGAPQSRTSGNLGTGFRFDSPERSTPGTEGFGGGGGGGNNSSFTFGDPQFTSSPTRNSNFSNFPFRAPGNVEEVFARDREMERVRRHRDKGRINYRDAHIRQEQQQASCSSNNKMKEEKVNETKAASVEERTEENTTHSNKSCVVCMENIAIYAVDPCGHLSLCEECSFHKSFRVPPTITGMDPRLLPFRGNCPECRSVIHKLMRIYV